jgi:hypothetical protein
MEPPPQPSARRPELGPELDRVIRRALAKYPAARPASARDLLEEAARALGVALPAPAEPPASGAVAATASRGKLRRPSLAISWPTLPTRSPSLGSRAPRRRAPALAAVVAAALGLFAGTVVAPFAGDAPDPSARASFRALLQHFDEHRAELRAELASAETPAAQAEAADELAAAYRRVADGGGSREAELAARSAERAYLALAAAAQAADADRFATASREVERTERAAVSAVAPR